jgi:peptide/nickel transport system permease protein
MTTAAIRTRPRRPSPRHRVTAAGVVGSLLLLVSLAVAFLGPLFAPYRPGQLAGAPLQRPSAAFPLGTDEFGRDLLSRVLNGGMDVVLVPLLATAIAFAVGAAIGMWSGYVGGWGETIVTRVVDVLISLPPLLLAIVFISSFGGSLGVLVLVSSAFFVPRIIRVVRGATTAVVAQDYVTASRVRGDSAVQIVWRDIMPNISGLLVVEFAARLSNVIMFIATLNFLGLGSQPPAANWGLMVAETTVLMRSNPWGPTVPALLIAALAVGVNLLSDELAARLTTSGTVRAP